MPKKKDSMNHNTDIVVSPEEKAADDAALQGAKEEEVRAGVIKEYGFDETTDKERIDKIVKRELDHTDKLSKAIGQKIKYRDSANGKNDDKPASKTPIDDKKEDIPTRDLYALMDAKIPQEDVDEVLKASKLLGKSITEALKDPIVQSILTKRQEERTVADAAHTGTARRQTPKADGRELANELLTKDKIPEKGSNEAEEIFWARRGGKR